MDNKWIPVEQELPMVDDEVLVTTRTKKGLLNVYKGYWGGAWWVTPGTAEVIAWMPLPAPYESDGDTNGN